MVVWLDTRIYKLQVVEGEAVLLEQSEASVNFLLGDLRDELEFVAAAAEGVNEDEGRGDLEVVVVFLAVDFDDGEANVARGVDVELGDVPFLLADVEVIDDILDSLANPV